jgi:hypothetical protein
MVASRGEMLTRDYFRVEDEAGCGSGCTATGFTTRDAQRRGRSRAAELVRARTVRMTAAHAYAEIGITTNFSFLRGGSHPQDYVHQASELGLPHRHCRSQHAGRRGAGLQGARKSRAQHKPNC